MYFKTDDFLKEEQFIWNYMTLTGEEKCDLSTQVTAN